MLVDHPMTLTIPVNDLERARSWYEDKLGLAPVQERRSADIPHRSGSVTPVVLL
jgi:catechol 2,3-dioxygenase-like lactoylglutathione lyase family enzyme